MIVSPQSRSDWEHIRTLCCLTGRAGEPIAQERWPFFGELWVGPYQRLIPSWTYLALKDSQPLGYLTGCPDTEHFATLKRRRFNLPLLFKILLRQFQTNSDTQRYLRQFLGLARTAESHFKEKWHQTLSTTYPAHLHMNVAKEARGLGIGKDLLDRFKADLRAKEVPGIHLYCGETASQFYSKVGFETLERIEIQPGSPVYLMGLPLIRSTI